VSKGLGRGLGALLGGDDEENKQVKETGQKTLSLHLLTPNPNQPRKAFKEEALKELTDSIKEKGIIQPILVEPGEDGKYLIVAGERRYRAATAAGLDEVPVVIHNYSEAETLEIALIENIQRQDLSAVEEARAYKHLMDTYGYSQEEVSKKVSKSRSAVANALRILKLPEDMLEALTLGDISAGHGRALLSVVNPADQRLLYSRILSSGLSVREAEAMSGELNKGIRPAGEAKKAKKNLVPELLQIEQKFIDALGTRVNVRGNGKKGKIEIDYYSSEDLERIFQILRPEDNLY
jgi:ParB family chromosome partitioning protein